MGIPSYFSHIIKKYAYILKKIDNASKFNNIYFDSNSIIYDALHIVDFINKEQYEEEIIKQVNIKLEELITLLKPDNIIYIAFDGVAPVAKLKQQKNRRYKSWVTSQLIPAEKKWDSLAITPGTLFMEKLTNGVKAYFKHKFKNQTIIVSGPDEPGEGEHKLYTHMRTEKCKPNDTCVVYGLDADLLMLSLFHLSYCPNLYVFREAPQFGPFKKEANDPEEPLFLDIAKLGRSIATEMRCKSTDIHRMVDYVFMCFFLGNDFLPHFPALNIRTGGINALMDAYRLKIGNRPEQFLVSRSMKIQWKNLYIFVKELASHEYHYIC